MSDNNEPRAGDAVHHAAISAVLRAQGRPCLTCENEAQYEVFLAVLAEVARQERDKGALNQALYRWAPHDGAIQTAAWAIREAMRLRAEGEI